MLCVYILTTRVLSVNYTASGIGKGKGFPHSLVVVKGGGVQWDQRPTVFWAKNMKGGAHSPLFAALFFPD